MRTFTLVAALSTLALSAPAIAAPILAGPGDAGYDAVLGALRDGYQRQQDVFAARENGLSLDTTFNAADVPKVKDFFAQTATTDFQTFSGKHPFEVIATYGEHGDEGNFAGIASVGVAARLMALRAAGAPAAELDAARAAAVRAARTWHVFGSIGGPGVVARGVRRVKPENPADPPLPGAPDPTVPLVDGNGQPQPAMKGDTWRAPVAPGLSDWIWIDDTSKDQVSGYALAAAWLWDALKDDAQVPPEVTADLAADLTAFVKELMKVAPELGIDLCIRDADGRLTSFHDLNPRQIVPEGVLPEASKLRNGFNAALALGIVRAAYHVSGDPAIGKYYYEDLVGERDFPSLVAGNAGIIFLGASTNYSNVNMLAIALATLGRFETDPYTRKKLGDAVESQFWSTGSDRDVSHVKQAWFDATYAGLAPKPHVEIRQRVAEDLGGFPPAPDFERDIVNCDAAELAALSCIAVDGKTVITLLTDMGHGGTVVAKDILPMSIRPDSDFEWRSDPHDVNGTGSTLMDPRGDWLAAYWLSRVLDLEDTTKNVSPNARAPLPYTLGAGGGGGAGAAPATPADAGDGGGCGCRVEGDQGSPGFLALVLVGGALAFSRRGRRRVRN